MNLSERADALKSRIRRLFGRSTEDNLDFEPTSATFARALVNGRNTEIIDVSAASTASDIAVMIGADPSGLRLAQNSGPMARWFRNVSQRVAAGEVVNVWAGIDSLTAGAGGFSWVQPFRSMVQGALGDAGIGFQIPSVNWEFGLPPVYYSGAGPVAVVAGDPSDAKYGAGIETLVAPEANAVATFNAGSATEINRETDEVDVFFLKKPTGQATSLRMYSFLSGPIFAGINPTGALGIGKQTLTHFGLKDGHAGTAVAIDQNNGAIRITGLNFRRICPNGGARVNMWAKGGAMVAQFAALDSTFQQAYFTEMGNDLHILCGGMNDRGTPVASFKANMEKLISDARGANPDCAVILLAPTNPGDNDASLILYRGALMELAEQYDCAFVDMEWILGTNKEAVAKGLVLPDTVHPSEAGSRRIASWLFEFIGGASLGQLYQTKYGARAPRRDVDATGVQGWIPGLPQPVDSVDPASVATPDTGRVTLFFNSSTSKLCIKDSSGTVTALH